LNRGRQPVALTGRISTWLGGLSSLLLPVRMFALAAIAAVLAGCGGGGSGQPQSVNGPSSRFEGMSANGLEAPEFALRDQHGQLVRLSAERGKYVVVTFLYVHCRNVCPIIAGQLNQALRELGPARKDVRVLAVSVDPKGDTPSAVRHFIAVHRLLPEFLYLTGTAKTLEPVWHEYHIASTQIGKGVVVGHTAIELLLDPSGKPRLLYDSQVTGQEVVHDLHALGLGA
jgi:protein SCO1/2